MIILLHIHKQARQQYICYKTLKSESRFVWMTGLYNPANQKICGKPLTMANGYVSFKIWYITFSKHAKILPLKWILILITVSISLSNSLSKDLLKYAASASNMDHASTYFMYKNSDDPQHARDLQWIINWKLSVVPD